MTRKIFKLAIPSIIENILQIMLSSVDTYFVATLGSIAISAVGVNSLISNLYLTFFIAVGTGVSILTARANGEGSKHKLRDNIQNAMLITIGLSVLFFFINLLFGKSILLLITNDHSFVDEAYLYFMVVIIPIGALAFMTVLSSIIKSLGDTKSPMITVFIINVINVILDYVLIRGIGSFNGIGIIGAGIATTFSRLVGCIILTYILNNRTQFIKHFTFCLKANIKEMIGYAIPVGLEKILMRIGQLIYGSLIFSIGITHYTGHNIAGTIEAYSYLPAMGFGIAAFTMIGHSIGEHNYDEIRTIGKLTFLYSTYFMLVIGTVFFIFAPQLAGIFTDDPEIIRLVSIVLRIIAVFQPFLCSTQVIASSLQALGDVMYPLYLTGFGIWFIRILGTYFLGIKLGYGLIGVWISYAFDVTFRGTLLWIRFNKKTKSSEYLRKEYLNESS
ncbi:MAG: MATE family efflux transporter [Clostridiales bacterium]|nr:MATE family efflux transporter [Clostridiales bacterium]